MDYCFDSTFVKNGTIYVSGWVTAKTRKNKVVINVLDEKGEEIEAKITRARRPDVGLAKFKNPRLNDVGVFLEIPEGNFHTAVVVMKEYRPGSEIPCARMRVPLNPVAVELRNRYKKFKKSLEKPKKDLKDLKDKLRETKQKEYTEWYAAMKVNFPEWCEQKKKKFPYEPKFSIVVPMFHTDPLFIKDMITSVVRQSYSNWELCLVNASPEDEDMSKAIRAWVKYDSRIRCIETENKGIAENTNCGIQASSGDFIAFLDHDDFLENDALYCYVSELNDNPSIDVFYSDEDKVDISGRKYHDPYFKSDFNRDLLYCSNYMCHFLAVRKTIVEKVGMLNPELDGAQDFDFILRCLEKTDHIYHLRRVLYHWRSTPVSTAANQTNKMYAFEAGERALNEHFKRLGVAATAEIGPMLGIYKIHYELTARPLVSFLIPNKDHTEDLDVCLRSLIERSTYENYEVIVIENNSTEEETFEYYKKAEKEWPDKVKIVYWKDIFNYSAINNFGFRYSKGEYIVLLNNDVEIITPDLIESMLGFCQRDEVGIVGAKLLYDDHTIQHAGVLVGAGGLADHVFKNLHEDAPGYMGKALCSQDVSAVTAACLMVKRSVYEEVGGLDESFQVAFNDVDFCLKVREKGYLVIYDADAKLFHYESKSRGNENTSEKFTRFGNEMYQLNSKWGILSKFTDPYYNPNFSYLDYYKMDHVAEKERRIENLKAQGLYEEKRRKKKTSVDHYTELQREKILERLSGSSRKTILRRN